MVGVTGGVGKGLGAVGTGVTFVPPPVATPMAMAIPMMTATVAKMARKRRVVQGYLEDGGASSSLGIRSSSREYGDDILGEEGECR